MTELLRDLVPWGMSILEQIESTRTSFGNFFFMAITHIGSEKSIIVLVSATYWAVDKRVGRGLAFCFLCSSQLNVFFKNLFHMPRPAEIPHVLGGPDIGSHTGIHPLMQEFSPSWPSNHAQGVAPGWGYLAYHANKLWLWILASAMFLLVGYSRMYIGVHFPQDVIGGWIIGLVFTALWILLEKRWREMLSGIPVAIQAALILVIPLILLIIFRIPAWNGVLGAMSGLGLGFIIEGRIVEFDVGGRMKARIGRVVIGLVIVFAVFLGLKVLFGELEIEPGGFTEYMLKATRYFVSGLVASWIAPWIFVRTGLAGKEGQV